MEKQIKETLWTKNFIMVSAINFFIILIFYLLVVTIGEYAVHEFGASTSIAGLVSSIFIIGTLLGRLFTGRIIVSFGTKKTFFVGLVFFVVTTLSYYFAGNLTLLMVVRLLHGMSVGIISTATGTVVAQIIPQTRRGEGIGYFSMSIVLATAIGPFIGMLLTQASNNYQIIFLFNTVLVAICVGIALLLKLEDSSHKKAANAADKNTGFSLRQYIEPKTINISFIALLVGFVYSGVMSFLSFYSKDINLVKAGSLFFLVYAIAILVSRPITGPLMDRRGANIIIYPALILFGIGMVLFSQASSSFAFLLAACIIGLGYGNFNSIAQTLAIKGIQPERLGHATSTYFILFDLGLGAGPFLLGYLVPILGYRHLFLALVPVLILSIILYSVLVGKKEAMEVKAA